VVAAADQILDLIDRYLEQLVIGDVGDRPDQALAYRDAGVTAAHFGDGDNARVWRIIDQTVTSGGSPDERTVRVHAIAAGIQPTYVARAIAALLD
jgi:hypothetical protein